MDLNRMRYLFNLNKAKSVIGFGCDLTNMKFSNSNQNLKEERKSKNREKRNEKDHCKYNKKAMK